MKKVVSTVVTLLMVFGFANIGLAETDKDCGDFSTWQEAQTFFNNNDPANDPHDLDRDDDGIVCESLSGYDSTYVAGTPVNGSDDATSDESSDEASDDSATDDTTEASDSEEQGDAMPDTATNYPAFMLLGMLVIVIGALLFVKRKAHE